MKTMAVSLLGSCHPTKPSMLHHCKTSNSTAAANKGVSNFLGFVFGFACLFVYMLGCLFVCLFVCWCVCFLVVVVFLFLFCFSLLAAKIFKRSTFSKNNDQEKKRCNLLSCPGHHKKKLESI